MIVAVKYRIFKMTEPSNKTPEQPSKTPGDLNKTSDDSNKPTEQSTKTPDESPTKTPEQSMKEEPSKTAASEPIKATEQQKAPGEKKPIVWAPVEKVQIESPDDDDDDGKEDEKREPLMNLPPLEPEQPHDGSPTPPVAPKPEANEMSTILPHLYVGKLSDLKDEKQMEKNHITHILSIYDAATPSDQVRQYLCISAKDNSLEKIQLHFSNANDFIHAGRQKGSVLIQCNSGISLSTTLAIAYIMTVTDFSCNQAKSIVQSRRVTAQPNLGFTKKLEKFEKESLANEKQRFRLLNPKELDKYNDRGECESVLASLQKNGKAAPK